jgi:small membrane protein
MSFFLPVQIMLLIFVLFAASRAILQFRGGTIRFGALTFWLLIWTVAIVAIFYPEETTRLAKLLGIGRGVDVVVYASIAILFYLVFRLHVYLENIRTEISRLIREVAIKEVKRGKSK